RGQVDGRLGHEVPRVVVASRWREIDPRSPQAELVDLRRIATVGQADEARRRARTRSMVALNLTQTTKHDGHPAVALIGQEVAKQVDVWDHGRHRRFRVITLLGGAEHLEMESALRTARGRDFSTDYRSALLKQRRGPKPKRAPLYSNSEVRTKVGHEVGA